MKIAVIGLGYVGLPLAVALARHFDLIGIDIDHIRIAELESGNDRTGEIGADVLARSTLALSADAEAGRGSDILIVTVPTPVDAGNRPDLRAVEAATRTVAGLIDPARCPIIVYESTVYPGVTEDVCGGLLSEAGLVRANHFELDDSVKSSCSRHDVYHIDDILSLSKVRPCRKFVIMGTLFHLNNVNDAS